MGAGGASEADDHPVRADILRSCTWLQAYSVLYTVTCRRESFRSNLDANQYAFLRCETIDSEATADCVAQKDGTLQARDLYQYLAH